MRRDDEREIAAPPTPLEAALDGEERSIELEYAGREWILHAVPITDERGDVFAGMTMVQDITERKEHQRRLERYKQYTDDILNAVDDVFYVVDDGSDLRRWNQSVCEVTGYSDAEIESMHALDFFGEDADRIANAIAEGFETGSVLVEATVRTKDGESIPYEFSAATLENSEGNSVLAGIGRDITARKERERELAKYETIVETINDGIYMKGEDGRFTMINNAYADLTGYDREELLGAHASLVVDEDAIEQSREMRTGTVDGEAADPTMETTIQRADGGAVPTEGTFATIQTGDGEQKRVVVVRDITERKEQRRRIEESERRYRTLAENFPSGAVAVYDDDLRFTLAQGSMLGDSLPSRDQIEGKTVSEVYPQYIVDDLDSLLRAAVEDGETGDARFEFGGRNWRVWATPLRDADGEIFAGLSFAQDVTEEVERERELERTLDLLERTERIADVGGWEIDPKTQDVFWSDHIFELLEVPGDEEPPLDEALDMYHEVDKSIVVDAVENALASGDSFDVEVRLRTAASNEVRWLRLQGVPEIVDGDVDSFRGAAQDITERKQREQQLEKLINDLETSNERLEQFAYAASHDLQEPLRMVSSYLQMIEQRYGDELDEDGEEFLEFAVDGADRMRNMIDGLLKYSRVETRGDSFEPIDLDTVFEDVREDLQVKIEENDTEITAESLPCVEGDEGQLRQVFQNLLDNAIEYSGDERPRVDISAERRDDEWIISVRDEGIGIEAYDTNRVFEVFESLHTLDDHSGMGIGLALCERIIERHGGDIWVDSEPGEGATFSFTLPVNGEHSE